MAAEGKPTLGEYLRIEREKRGLTLEQVASATKIGIKFLHALESDQYADLPAKPFVRGFVTSYSRFIGMDHKEVLTLFSDFIDEKAHERPARDAGHSGYAFEKREGDQSRVILASLMGGFVVIGGVAFLIVKPSLKHHHGSHVEKLKAVHAQVSPSTLPFPSSDPAALALATLVSSPVPQVSPTSPEWTPPLVFNPSPSPSAADETKPSPTPSPSAASSPGASPAPSHSASPSPSPSPSASPTGKPEPLNNGVSLKNSEVKHKAVFKALESVWIRYQVDDRPSMLFVLKKDKVLVVRAKERIVFQAAKPEDVTVTFDGSRTKSLSNEKGLVTRQENVTLVIPHQVADSIENPFPGGKALSDLAPLPRTAPSPLSTSAE